MCKKSSIFLSRDMLDKRKIMISLCIKKETGIFYLRNRTTLNKKKDCQYMGKNLKTGMFNLSRHYGIISGAKIWHGASDYKIQVELYSGKYIRANKSHQIIFLWLRK